MPTLTLGLEITTVRVPELIDLIELAPEDMIIVWDASANKTRKVPISTISTYITAPTGGSYAPVQVGDSILYEVPPEDEGLDEKVITALAGKNIIIRRDGFPLNASEYEVLDIGGFKLLGTTFITGQRYELIVSELSDGTTPGASSSSGGFIAGEVPIPTNINIAVEDLNKIHQVRGGSTALTITLPDIDDCPEKSFVIIESIIGNTKQHLINTTAAQYIYRKNQSIDNGIYLGVGEVIWFYRGADGWYVISEIGEWDNVGNPIGVYKAALNQIVLNGQTLLRATYPKLFREIQSFGSSYIPQAQKDIASVYSKDGVFYTSPPAAPYRTILKPYKGCWGDGDGLTTFTAPDYMNSALRGIKSESGSDTERYLNAPGGFQDNTNKKFWSGTIANPVILKVDGANTTVTFDTDPGLTQPNIITPVAVDQSTFSTESRMDNIGILWVTNF